MTSTTSLKLFHIASLTPIIECGNIISICDFIKRGQWVNWVMALENERKITRKSKHLQSSGGRSRKIWSKKMKENCLFPCYYWCKHFHLIKHLSERENLFHREHNRSKKMMIYFHLKIFYDEKEEDFLCEVKSLRWRIKAQFYKF